MAVTQVGILIEIGLFLGVRKLIIWTWGCQADFDATYAYFAPVSARGKGSSAAQSGGDGNKNPEIGEIMSRGYVFLCQGKRWPQRTKTPDGYSPVADEYPPAARQRPFPQSLSRCWSPGR